MHKHLIIRYKVLEASIMANQIQNTENTENTELKSNLFEEELSDAELMVVSGGLVGGVADGFGSFVQQTTIAVNNIYREAVK